MGIDQYGNEYHSLSVDHPRKDLLGKLGRKHCAKMYCDKKDGSVSHTGYIIAGLWIRLYYVAFWERAA
jgi:hypothetical protein